PKAWLSSSCTRSGRTAVRSGIVWFQSPTRANGSELRNGRYRITEHGHDDRGRERLEQTVRGPVGSRGILSSPHRVNATGSGSQGTATSTSCPSIFTSKTACLIFCPSGVFPVLMSNCQPCHGQVTIVPCSVPSTS